jgi:S-adenosylmethionine decarboxylase
MLVKDLDLDDYLFGIGDAAFTKAEQDDIRERINTEMLEIFYARNLHKGNSSEI